MFTRIIRIKDFKKLSKNQKKQQKIDFDIKKCDMYIYKKNILLY